MKRVTIAGGLFAAVLALLALFAVLGGFRSGQKRVAPAAASAPASSPVAPSAPAVEASSASATAPSATAPPASQPASNAQGFLYGRVTTVDGATHEGRLRWGDGQEAFWNDSFNGFERENPWLAHVPPEALRRPVRIFGMEVGSQSVGEDFGRQFMMRFGDLARIDASGRDVRVTTKSGAVFELDRFDSSDFDDGVRVWEKGGAVDFDSTEIRSIELLPTPELANAPARLRGTVRTSEGDFTGFVAWDREHGVGTDELRGKFADGELELRLDGIRSIESRPQSRALVTLADGRELELGASREIGADNRGISIDDPRYGRVIVSWSAFERLDFDRGSPDAPGAAPSSGPAYSDFRPGRPLAGGVVLRGGRRLAGRLVFDLDESETGETLDTASPGVDYSIPFRRIASIGLEGRAGAGQDEEPGGERARVTLDSGEELRLERTGDLGKVNAGLLVFAEGRSAEYVPWSEVERIEFEREPAQAEATSR